MRLSSTIPRCAAKSFAVRLRCAGVLPKTKELVTGGTLIAKEPPDVQELVTHIIASACLRFVILTVPPGCVA